MNTHASLADQIREIEPKLRSGRPYLRRVFEITAKLGGEDGQEAVRLAREAALRWIRNRSGALPEKAWKFEAFDLDQAGVAPASVVAIKGQHDIWAARLHDADHVVPGRSWTTEIMVALSSDGTGLFGTRLMVSTREGELPYQSSTPGLVKQVIEAPGLVDDQHLLLLQPDTINSHDAVDDLVSFIESPIRQLPILLVTLREEDASSKDAVIDAERVASRSAGLAHVILLPHEFTFRLTNILGKEFSAFEGAVRTYWPGFDRYEDRPYRHQLALRDRIESWGIRGALDFEDLLIESAYRWSISKPDAEEKFPRFSSVRSYVTQARRIAAENRNDISEQLELAWLEIEELKQDKNEWEELAQSETVDRKQAQLSADDQRQENHRLRTRISVLEDQIEQISDSPIDSTVPIPDSLDRLREWADLNLAGRLLITGRAARAAKNAEFSDTELAYKAILLLANEYRNMKLYASRENKEKFEANCIKLGLDCSQTFSGPGAGEQGDEYFMLWNGRRQPLDTHLKNGGNTRDPSRCFRVYFFWDDIDQQVVVGSMPAHLRSRLT